ncbi:hypothetical protein TraAM80_06510 [Trypanosoma rangeli]|uniref:Uncharacterized protein n=1 Tax=Trypanosoma rangeli TaxID=5698 RepID=A0A422N9S0_TRYRA|nr:uncharacterized protein TraAM80_06510 [Trypanosoma rangeli]RNF02217.1 hypothetical protein TraAM80_06510 [Trypanosoma rangeli]|eukprot:RNF02217.1 hypothetical protein TraAM80_06510 [Trypanosoma rangeli]
MGGPLRSDASANEAQESREIGEGGYREGGAPAAHSIDHVGTRCRVRFIQGNSFCPIYRVAELSVAYALMNDGSFSIRFDTDVRVPIVAKLEVNGKMFNNEYRILPNGSRTVKEVHEPNVATTRAFVYHPLIVFDNVLQREVSPGEMELRTIEEANEFTSLFRVFFLSVKGGVAATREGVWKINYKKEPLAVEMVRVGHRAMLAKLFDVSLAELVKSLRQASPSRPSSVSRTLSLAPPPLPAPAMSPRRRSDADSFLPLRSTSTTSFSRWTSRSTSIERGTRPRASSLTCFMQSSGALQGHDSPVQRSLSGGKRHAAPRQLRRGRRVDSSRSPKPGRKSASRSSPPSPSVLHVMPTPRVNSPTPPSLHSRGNGSSVSRTAARKKILPFGLKGKSFLAGENDVEKQGSKNNSYHICVGCNAVFERERVLFYEIVTHLKEKVCALQQENVELRARCGEDASFSLNCTDALNQAPPTLYLEGLDTTLQPPDGFRQEEEEENEMDVNPLLTPDLSHDKSGSSEGAVVGYC